MKENILSFARTILVGAGVFLIGGVVYGINVTDDFYQAVVGGILALGGLIWGIVDKSLDDEKFEALCKAIGVAVGAILLVLGKADERQVASLLGVFGMLASFLWSVFNKRKALKVKRGLIVPARMAGARPKDLK